MKLTNLLVGATLAGICSGSVASATVLYDNGAISLSKPGYLISGGQAIGDSFTLTAASVVTGVDFGAYAAAGDTFETVDWGITADPTAIPDKGAATVTTGALSVSNIFNNGTYDVSMDSFSTGHGVALAAGTYYLWLQNAVTSNGDDLFWNINNGPSSAKGAVGGFPPRNLAGLEFPGTNSEAFQIIGRVDAVPEPAVWVMMLAGFGAVGGAIRRGRKAMAVAA